MTRTKRARKPNDNKKDINVEKATPSLENQTPTKMDQDQKNTVIEEMPSKKVKRDEPQKGKLEQNSIDDKQQQNKQQSNRQKKKHNNKNNRQNKQQDNRRNDRSGSYKPVIQQNALMEAYYDYQGLFDKTWVEDSKVFKQNSTKEEKQAEKEKFYECIRSILPASFRIRQDLPQVFRKNIIKEVQEHCGDAIEIEIETQYGVDQPNLGKDNTENLMEVDEENKEKKKVKVGVKKIITPAQSIPYIPHAYQLSIDKRTIKRNDKLAEFHEWLKIQTAAGFLTRQETVSMIPPIVLGVKSKHMVLDMCAAPGSKTSQLLEIVSRIHKGEKEPRGLVVANDNEIKRAYMLVTQLHRINSPAIFVTSCDAQRFPQLNKAKKGGDGMDEGFFDRVLADVPCTGDGTVRKNPGIWKQWTQLAAIGIHQIQFSIAHTGARLAKVGGYICYSTCSMNPIENEAVVAELLRKSNGNLKLVDHRSKTPGIVARPGMNTWKVMISASRKKNGKNSRKMIEKRKELAKQRGEDSPAGEREKSDNKDEPTPYHDWNDDAMKQAAMDAGLKVYDSFEDVPKEERKRVRESCFPPSKEEQKSFHLERCMRILPHDMNTGAFFVALFHKTGPIGYVAQLNSKQTQEVQEAESIVEEDNSREQGNGEGRNKKGNERYGFTKFVPVDTEMFLPLKNYYGFSDDFPQDQIMIREGSSAKMMYYVTEQTNELFKTDIQKCVSVNAGLKALERSSKDAEVNYRVNQDAIQFIAPYMTKRKFVVNARDFCLCMNDGGIWTGNFSSDFTSKILELKEGSFVVVLEGFENDIEKKMMMVMWRCRGDAVNCLVSKIEKPGIESKLRALGLLVKVDLKISPHKRAAMQVDEAEEAESEKQSTENQDEDEDEDANEDEDEDANEDEDEDENVDEDEDAN